MSYNKPRLGFGMNLQDIMRAFAEEDNEAYMIVSGLIQFEGYVDMASAFSRVPANQDDPEKFIGLSTLMGFDSSDIYGHDIVTLMESVCGNNIGNVILIMRACQLGFINTNDIKDHITKQKKFEGFKQLHEKVKERLGTEFDWGGAEERWNEYKLECVKKAYNTMVDERKRIQEITDLLTPISEGNPGALTVLLNITTSYDIEETKKIISVLQSANITGSLIWCLYKDVCHEDLEVTIKLIHAADQNILTLEELKTASQNYGRNIDVLDILSKMEE